MNQSPFSFLCVVARSSLFTAWPVCQTCWGLWCWHARIPCIATSSPGGKTAFGPALHPQLWLYMTSGDFFLLFLELCSNAEAQLLQPCMGETELIYRVFPKASCAILACFFSDDLYTGITAFLFNVAADVCILKWRRDFKYRDAHYGTVALPAFCLK